MPYANNFYPNITKWLDIENIYLKWSNLYFWTLNIQWMHNSLKILNSNMANIWQPTESQNSRQYHLPSLSPFHLEKTLIFTCSLVAQTSISPNFAQIAK